MPRAACHILLSGEEGLSGDLLPPLRLPVWVQLPSQTPGSFLVQGTRWRGWRGSPAPPLAAFAWGRPLSRRRHRAEGTEHPPGRTPASRPCAPDLSRAQGSCALSTACGLSSRACSGCCLPRGAFSQAGAGPHSCLTGASLLGAPGVPPTSCHCIRVSRVSFPSGRGEEGGEERGDNSVGPVPALSN